MGAGIPDGNDAMAHLFKIWYIGGQITSGHGFPVWLPHWYEGTDLFKYYQPLFYIVATPFYLLTKNVFTTYKIMAMLWAGGMSLAMYSVVYRRLGLFPAIIAGILYTLAPPVTRAFFYVGLLPQAFSYVFLPVAFHFTLRLADEEQYRAKTVALLSVVWGLFIIAHPMSAAFSMIATFIFIGVYQALRKDKRHPLVITRYILSAVLGIGIAALWFVPAYFGRIASPAAGEAIVTTSVPLRELLGLLSRDNAVFGRYIPIAFSVLAIAGTLWRRTAMSWGLAAMGVFTLFFALGIQTPIYKLVPLSSAIFPEYALFGACFAFSFLAARMFERTSRSRAMDIATVVVVLIFVCAALYESAPAYTLIKNTKAPADIVALLNKSRTLSADGRVSMLGQSSAILSYYPTVMTGRGVTEGFFFQGTNHYKEIANLNDVVNHRYSSAYTHRKLDQWNARYIISHKATLEKYPKIIPPEFKRVATEDLWSLFYRQAPAKKLQVMNHDSIVIGKNPSAVSLRYPWIIEGGQYIDDYDWKFLSRFKRVLLIGFSFHDRKTAIDLITKLADSGRTVIIDLQDVQSEFGTESVSFMDILPIPYSTNGDMPLKPNTMDGNLGKSPLKINNLTYGGEPWKSVVYTGLDESIYDISDRGKTYSVLGIKKVGAGNVYFVGLNLFFHNMLTNDKAARQITDVLAGPVEKDIYMPRFAALNQTWGTDHSSFSYTSKTEEPVVVSATWTENWSAMIDGKPLRAYDYENLPLFFLPSGKHTVEMKYGTTPLQVFAMIISVICVGIVLLILIRSVRHQLSIDYPRV